MDTDTEVIAALWQGRLFSLIQANPNLLKILRRSGLTELQAKFWIYRSVVRFSFVPHAREPIGYLPPIDKPS